jgi:hypothetical protein
MRERGRAGSNSELWSTWQAVQMSLELGKLKVMGRVADEGSG